MEKVHKNDTSSNKTSWKSFSICLQAVKFLRYELCGRGLSFDSQQGQGISVFSEVSWLVVGSTYTNMA
jgi:hypothetical protein